ncbi:MAG TPA: O-antigen ligase family protein, partial [Candidatus Sumerlaeia bacterium]|nr:O-antigen ligase family protein [Candidatus Sumerlaeia bacterium]
AYILLNLISGFAAQSLSLWRSGCLNWVMLFLCSLLLQDILYGNRRGVMMIVWALACCTAITATWALWQDFAASFFKELVRTQPRLSDWRGFISAGLGNTGYIADYLAVLFPMNILLHFHNRGRARRFFTFYTLMSNYAALIVCWSVQSNAGLILALIVLLILLIKYKPRAFWRGNKGRIGALIAGWILITLFYITPLPINPHKPSIFKQAFGSERWRYGGESRLVIWAQSLEILRKHPWLGCGAGNFTYQYVQQASPFLLNHPNRLKYIGLYTNGAHNEALQSWAELGIAGPAILLALLLIVAKVLKSKLEWSGHIHRWTAAGALCGMTCAVLPAMMAYPMELPASQMLFIFLCSLPIIMVSRNKYSSGAINIPVEFHWRGVHVSALLENFQKPVGGMIHFEMKPAFVRIFTFLLIPLFGFLCFQTVKPIVSDAYFKSGRILTQSFERGLVLENLAWKGAGYMERSLEWWGNNHDCRSTLGQFLSRQGRHEEAERHLRKTLERLQAAELYEHLGRSLEGLGKNAEAAQAYKTLFERNPLMVYYAPDFYRHYQELLKK